MAIVGTADILIRPNDRGFRRDLNTKVGGAFRSVAAVAAGAFAAVQVGQFFAGAIAEAEEAQKVMGLTNAVIKSTKGVANVSGEALGKLADRLSNVAAVDDEVIQSAGNVLLTFTKVQNQIGKGNNIFDQAAESALNMSAALGTDLQGATLQVGKALNDPIAGVTALTRAGVQFTKQQKAQIKSLVASGDQLGAQKVILKELTTQFKGAAAAAATPSQKLKVAFDNIKESIGQRLLPFVAKLVDAFTRNVGPATEKIKKAFKDAQPFIARMGEIFRTVVSVIRTAITAIMPTLRQLFATFQSVFASIRSIVTSVVGFIQALWARFGAQIMANAQRVWNGIKGIISGVLMFIRGIFSAFAALLRGDWSGLWNGLKTAVAGIWKAIQGVIGVAIGELRHIISLAMGIIAEVWKGIWTKMRDAVSSIFGGIKRILVNILNFIIRNVINKLIGALNSLVDKIDIALGPFVNIGNIGKISEITVNGPASTANAGDFRNADNNTGGLGTSRNLPGKPIQVNLNIDGKTAATALLPGVRAVQRSRR